VTTNKSVSEVMATKSITEFVEKCEIDGKQWHRCKWLECNYSTVRSDSIVRHMRRHTGDRPYKCELCSYATIQSSALKIHIRRHTGEKPYKCNFDNCGKRFTVLATLLIHERTHTGLKPFKCKSLNCGYASIERSKLSIHMKKIHGLKPNQHIPINTNNNNNNNYVSNADEDVLKSSQLIPLNIFSNISSTSCENIQGFNHFICNIFLYLIKLRIELKLFLCPNLIIH
jgi:KRAB domain-containing zinc finger protein